MFDFTSHNAVLYAIWGYNANVTLTDYIGSASGNTLPVSSVTDENAKIDFSAWYTDKDFASDTYTTLQSNVYKYYARMSFKLTVTIEVGSGTYYIEGDEQQTTSSPYAWSKTIYEGDTVSVEYSTADNSWKSGWSSGTNSYTIAEITITHDGEDKVIKLYIQKTNGSGNRYLYICKDGYTGNWTNVKYVYKSKAAADDTESSGVSDSNRINADTYADYATSATVCSNLGLYYYA